MAGAQDVSRLRELAARYLKAHPEADTDGDGTLSISEFQAHRAKAQAKGDAGAAPPEDAVMDNAKKAVNKAGVPATYADVPYGDHERNLLDIWLAPSGTPTPLVIYIHGGGFTAGDKSKGWTQPEMPEFLKAGVSFATLGYRYRDTDPRGILACLMDSKRAVQFLRSKADEWNLDKTRFIAFGGSAGAGTSLWLAFHDDMAEPDSPDPVLRESTRLTAAGAFSTQATYDITQWPKLLTGKPLNEAASALLEQAKERAAEQGTTMVQMRNELDMLGLMSKDDAPFYASNPQANSELDFLNPADRGKINHHPRHVLALQERAKEVGLEAQCYAPGLNIEAPEDEQETFVEFCLRQFGMEGK